MNFRDILMVAATQGGGAAAAAPYTANAVDFNGSNQYCEILTDFAGAVDSSTGIFSAWLRFDGGNGSTQSIHVNGPVSTYVRKATTNLFAVALTSDGGLGFFFGSVTAYTSGATWYHLLISWNTNFTAGNKIGQLYVNDVDDYALGNDNDAAFTVNYTPGAWGVAARSTAHSTLLNGCLSDLYFAPGQYLDFSNSANRRKFISATGKPVSLGADGSTPTGTAPILYLPNAFGTVNVNAGTGGNMTLGGTPTACSTSPSS